MGVFLLADRISFPNFREGFNNRKWVGSSMLLHFFQKCCIRALIAALLSLTLFLVCFAKHKLSEWSCMCQTLHYCIEEASIPVILHGVSALINICELLCYSVSLHIRHHFKTAIITASGHNR